MFRARHIFRVCTGACYLGGYIRDNESKHDYLRERMLTWEKNINTIRETTWKYPQKSYAAVLCAVQSEWIFLQHVTWNTGELFAGAEKMIRETFLPRLLFGNKKTISPVVGSLSKIPAKKSGLGLLNTVAPAQ